MTDSSTSLVKPSGESIIAAGTWCPNKSELNLIRSSLLRPRSCARFREIISRPAFTALFGPPKPRKDGGRQNIFGMEDELKVAPKIAGMDSKQVKEHREIALLKCRSFAVSKRWVDISWVSDEMLIRLLTRFTDEEVLDPEFKNNLGEVVEVVRDFVHWFVHHPVKLSSFFLLLT
jgi:hypothetical protein